MSFREVPTEADFPALERRILKFWEASRAFDLLRRKNAGGPRYSFLDGPITANNPMGVHHAWGRTYKDIFQRYKAMQGHELRYQNGFDCQGLWVEVEVERELGFRSKRDIEAYGIDRFVEACKARVRKYSGIQTAQSIRLGYWMDWSNSYYTMSDENNYTIWLFLSRCHRNGWIYRGRDVMPWCARCGTALSEHEIATEGYQEMTHTSVVVRFPIVGRAKESLLVWTTTPWTLTSNVAAAVHPEFRYVCARQGDERLYLAKGTVGALRGPYAIERELAGRELVGLRYRGPFDELPAQRGVEHRVIAWEEVSEAEGTGIVHIAPGCGKEDFELGKIEDLPAIAPLDEFGNYIEGFGWLDGKSAAGVAEEIVEDLGRKGILYAREAYAHRYPVCWRCGTELVFRLVDEWFIRMDELRFRIMDVARRIVWMPEFGLEHELDWLRNMHDWCISKKRYWGLALPIFTCPCGWFDVVGGEEELEARAVSGWESFVGHSPHRPWIDAVRIRCAGCGGEASRIPDVGNPWLDAGIVPFSTMGYRKDRAYWERWFPADFITECFPGQFRNWFYSLLAMATVLENREPFRRVLGHALVKDERGEEMHKSKGNAIWFDEAAERMGVEVMRWIFARQNPFQNLHFGYGVGDEIRRKLLGLWNAYVFFVTYARLEDYRPDIRPIPLAERPPLDRWIVSRLEQLIARTRAALDEYMVMHAARETEAFVEDLSNWYIRRSRRRFWRGGGDPEAWAGFHTLYEVLTTLARLLAPILPFLSEEIHQNLLRGIDPASPVSVHLEPYPEADPSRIDEELLRRFELVQRIVSLGRRARRESGIKVRQPLAEVRVAVRHPWEREALRALAEHVLEELNVRRLEIVEDPESLVRHRLKPNYRLLGQRFQREMPVARAAIEALDPEEAAGRLRAGEQISIRVGGREEVLSPEEILIEARAVEGVRAVEEGEHIVAIDTRIDDDLRAEGLARESTHLIQNARKEAGFAIQDRIELRWETEDPVLAAAIEAHASRIAGEVLAVRFERGLAAAEAKEISVDGRAARIALRRV